MPRSASNGAPRRRAFSLIEVVVAVGVLAVVTVAIATVFDSVGKTVSRGASLSTLTRLAFRIETIMQRDFEGLREGTGFLVIRNEYARRDWDDAVQDVSDLDPTLGDFDGVPLFDGEARPRMRRIDEIMFFNNSDRFRTRRTPLHPSLVAEAGEARIYYGHGQRTPRDVDGDGVVDPYRGEGTLDFREAADPDWRYDRPRLDDLNDVTVPNGSARLGQRSTVDFRNPNEFASDWLLVRHVTLLHPVTRGVRDLPENVFGMDPVGLPTTTPNDVALARARVQDNSRQIALQPAAQTIFQPLTALRPRRIEDRALFETGALAGGSDDAIWGIRAIADFAETSNNFYTAISDTPGGSPRRAEYLAPPAFASGLVDIATMELSEIRSYVETGLTPVAAGVPEYTPREIATDSGRPDFADFVADRTNPEDRQPNPLRDVNTPSNTRRTDQVQQEWMLAALPSLPFDPFASAAAGAPGFRMRAERRPPVLYPPVRELADGDTRLDWIDRYSAEGYPSTMEVQQVQEMMFAIEQADQEMLVNNVFIPNCTEFIVEWSYGITDDRISDNPSVVRGQLIWHGLRRWEDFDGDEADYDPVEDVLVADLFADAGAGFVTYDNQPIVEISGTGGFKIPERIRSATFPFRVDPRIEALTLMRDRANAAVKPTAVSGQTAEYVWGYADRDDDGNTLDWPWPELIRITIRVVDQTDPTQEQTYQVIFPVRKPRGGDL